MSADFTHGTAAQDAYVLDASSIVAADVHGPDQLPEEAALPAHATGTQLRRRFVTPESIAELRDTEKPSLLQRLLRRK